MLTWIVIDVSKPILTSPQLSYVKFLSTKREEVANLRRKFAEFGFLLVLLNRKTRSNLVGAKHQKYNEYKNHHLRSILSSNIKVMNRHLTLNPIILLPLMCSTILVVLLFCIIFICCTKHLEHEPDADDILELPTFEPNHGIPHGSIEEIREDRCYRWVPRTQSLSPIPELHESNEELSINCERSRNSIWFYKTSFCKIRNPFNNFQDSLKSSIENLWDKNLSYKLLLHTSCYNSFHIIK